MNYLEHKKKLLKKLYILINNMELHDEFIQILIEVVAYIFLDKMVL